jgi:hypothetical protein
MPVQVASCRLQPVAVLDLLHTPRLVPGGVNTVDRDREP